MTIASIVTGAVQGLAGSANEIVKTVWGSREQKDVALAEEQRMVLQAFANESLPRSGVVRTWWDSLVDGINRLVRPVFTFGTAWLIGYAVYDPAAFALAMQALAIVPEWLWATMGGILAFWFGGRMAERVPQGVKIDPDKIKLAQRLVLESKERDAAAQAIEAGLAAPVTDVVTPVALEAPAVPMPEATWNRIIEVLKVHEGWRANAYRDSVGVLTVGYGHNMQAHPLPEGMSLPLSKEDGERLLVDDLWRVVDELDRSLPWWRSLDPVRQHVLADMGFNLGVPGLLKFKNTLKAVQEGRWADAKAGMRNSLWAKQVGNRAVKLSNWMEKGVYV